MIKKICIITDNEFIFDNMKKIIKCETYKEYDFDFFYSEWNKSFNEKYANDKAFNSINLKKCNIDFLNNYSLFLSLHCKQLFPEMLVDNFRCINIHPGYNPYNRGWYPQVFSIINKYPVGVTVHEMDRYLDHGPIIYQQKIEVEASDTSVDVYKKIQKLEIEILKDKLYEIIENKYDKINMQNEGNINLKKDFDAMCEIDLNKISTYGEVLDYLRAMTFEGYKNAYFFNKNGKKVYVSIELEEEK